MWSETLRLELCWRIVQLSPVKARSRDLHPDIEVFPAPLKAVRVSTTPMDALCGLVDSSRIITPSSERREGFSTSPPSSTSSWIQLGIHGDAKEPGILAVLALYSKADEILRSADLRGMYDFAALEARGFVPEGINLQLVWPEFHENKQSLPRIATALSLHLGHDL